MYGFVRSFSKARIYGHAVGRIMVHEATFLNWQQVERLIESGFSEALAVALETVYGPYLEGATLSSEIEAGLERYLTDEYRFIDQVTAGTLVSEFLHLRYDFHNLRVVLKRHYFGDSGVDGLISSLGTVDPERIREAVESEKPSLVNGRLAPAVEAALSMAAEGRIDPQRMDTLVDREFLEKRLEIARDEGSKLLESFCSSAIDVANLRVMLRGINLGKDTDFYELAFAEGGKLERKDLLKLSGEPFEVVVERLLDSRYGRMLSEALVRGEEKVRLTSLDKESDEYLLDQVKVFTRVSMGPERIVRFVLTRENEVSMLRIIFMGKLHGLSPEVVEARLPLGYMSPGVGAVV